MNIEITRIRVIGASMNGPTCVEELCSAGIDGTVLTQRRSR